MKSGFTLIELIISIGVLTTLMAYATINVVRPIQQTSIKDTATVLVSDMRLQQSKAMLGDTEGTSAPDLYGIFFATDAYTLFRGSSYDPSDTANQVYRLETGLVFSAVNLPDSSVIFTRGSGEVSGFVSASNSFSLTTTDGTASLPFFINKYGVITY